MNKFETEEWKLGAFIEWRPKPISIACPRCGGVGTIGGGFKDIDGPRDCTECWGTKVKKIAPTSKQPEIPSDLIEYMRRAWWDYMNAHVPTKEMNDSYRNLNDGEIIQVGDEVLSYGKTWSVVEITDHTLVGNLFDSLIHYQIRRKQKP